MSKCELSVIMPVYNELGTIAEIIKIVQHALPQVKKELVIVDDDSQDGTRAWLAENFGPAGDRQDNCAVRIIFHERNKGKGGAVQTGLKVCTGDVIVIPAGVAHQNIGASDDFSVVGAYPGGRSWDLLRGLSGERPKADHNIAALPMLDKDPVYGAEGPLRRIWKDAGASSK